MATGQIGYRQAAERGRFTVRSASLDAWRPPRGGADKTPVASRPSAPAAEALSRRLPLNHEGGPARKPTATKSNSAPSTADPGRIAISADQRNKRVPLSAAPP